MLKARTTAILQLRLSALKGHGGISRVPVLFWVIGLLSLGISQNCTLMLHSLFCSVLYYNVVSSKFKADIEKCSFKKKVSVFCHGLATWSHLMKRALLGVGMGHGHRGWAAACLLHSVDDANNSSFLNAYITVKWNNSQHKSQEFPFNLRVSLWAFWFSLDKY